MRSASYLLLLAAGILAVGCSNRPAFGEVEGTVTLDGVPVEGIVIYFVPDLSEGSNGPTSWGATDTAGFYSLAHMRTGERGALVGKHRVTCRPPEALPPGRKQTVQIPERYQDQKTTPLRFEVRDGKQTIDIRLTTGP